MSLEKFVVDELPDYVIYLSQMQLFKKVTHKTICFLLYATSFETILVLFSPLAATNSIISSPPSSGFLSCMHASWFTDHVIVFLEVGSILLKCFILTGKVL
jgi:hypothetical protein